MIPLLTALVVALAPLPAHATVLDTNPADGEVLTAAIDAFTVTVNENVLDVGGVDTANAITITDAEGGFYGDGCSVVDGDELSTTAVLGEPGDYTMSYALVSADGHTIDGAVTFAWQPSGEAETAEAAAEPPTCGETATEEPNGDSGAAPSSDAPAEAEEGQPGWLIGLGIAGLVVVALLVVGTLLGALRRRR